MWWSHASDERRYDHGPMYVTTMLALWFTSISMILLGPTPTGPISDLSEITQIMLSDLLLMGSTTCLIGSASGTHLLFRKWKRTRCYNWGIVGIPMVCTTIIFYGYAVAVNTQNFASALGGTLGPFLGIGCAVNGFYLWLEIRRIERNVEKLKQLETDECNPDE